ncbi:FtsX-like permease family protein [Nocardioides sp.]|uniref:FtsX-like permease family protein n=1 Tax=Nocardioides sp. TaxID=35761 RepID=UPI002ED4350E
MTGASTGTLALRRARAHPAPVVAVLVNVLIVCTLVAGLGASLSLLQQEALRTALQTEPTERTTVAAFSPYDDDDPAGQHQVIADSLAPVTGVAGGDIVHVTESGTYELAAPGRPLWTFAAVTGADAELDIAGGAPPAHGAGPVEVAAPVSSAMAVGDRIELVSRSGAEPVAAVVVSTWAPAPDSERWLGDLGGDSLLVAPETFPDLAGSSASGRWRAVPDLDALAPDQLADLARAVVAAEADLAAAGETLSTTVQSDTDIPATLGARARELVVLRALLLVPAALLLLLGAASLFLVASGLADSRRDDEALLRSRGGGYRQLVGPTVLETLVLCSVAAAAAPLVANLAIRIGDVKPPLEAAAWVASGVAGGVCAIALIVPVVLGAVSGDRGQQLSVERQRRRALTALVAGVLFVTVLGALAVAQLRGFGDTVGDATTTAGPVDPMVVSSPALLLLALAVVVAVLVLPPVFRAVARTLGRQGVSVALGTRFAARATRQVVPLALVVILAAGTLSFAAIQFASSATARDARADFEAGADVRVIPPVDVLRTDSLQEVQELAAVPGVQSVRAVRRNGTFVDDLPADALVASLDRDMAAELLPSASVAAGVWEDLVARPWADPTVGVPLPDGADRIVVASPDVDLGRLEAMFVDADGDVVVVAAEGDGERVVIDAGGGLPADSRLAGLHLGAQAALGDQPSIGIRATARVDGEQVADAARLSNPGSGTWLTFGDPPELPDSVPVVLTSDLARDASLTAGDTVELSVLGLPTRMRIVGTVPYVRTVGTSAGGGLLLDAGSVLPALLVGGAVEAPDEWWLSTDPGREASVAEALLARPELARGVVTRAEVERRLDDDPSTGGAALARVLVLTAVGCLLVGCLLLLSVVLLRRRERAAQDRVLVAVGAARRDLVGVLGIEYLITTGAGALAGGALGAVVAGVTLRSMTLGPDGRLLVPAPELVAPWPLLLGGLVVLVVVPMLAMLALRRLDHGRELVAEDIGRAR